MKYHLTGMRDNLVYSLGETTPAEPWHVNAYTLIARREVKILSLAPIHLPSLH